MEDKYKLEDRVILVHSSYLNLHGVLKYKGQIEGTPPGVWFGVDLDVFYFHLTMFLIDFSLVGT